MWLTCRSASRIITVSQAAKREVVDYIGILPDRIDRICEGVDPAPCSDHRGRTADGCVASRRHSAGGPPNIECERDSTTQNLLNLLARFAEVAPLMLDCTCRAAELILTSLERCAREG